MKSSSSDMVVARWIADGRLGTVGFYVRSEVEVLSSQIGC
jgi:hypothetical protein